MNYKKDDIVRWGYTDNELKKRDDGNNGGTTYWCKARIAVFNGDEFVDTWHGNDNLHFSPQDIGRTFVVNYIGNFADLEKLNYGDYWHWRQFYNEKDLADLNHPNNSKGNLYLRKGAKKNLELIRERLMDKERELVDKAEYAKRRANEIKEFLENFSEDNVEEAGNFLY